MLIIRQQSFQRNSAKGRVGNRPNWFGTARLADILMNIRDRHILHTGRRVGYMGVFDN